MVNSSGLLAAFKMEQGHGDVALHLAAWVAKDQIVKTQCCRQSAPSTTTSTTGVKHLAVSAAATITMSLQSVTANKMLCADHAGPSAVQLP